MIKIRSVQLLFYQSFFGAHWGARMSFEIKHDLSQIFYCVFFVVDVMLVVCKIRKVAKNWIPNASARPSVHQKCLEKQYQYRSYLSIENKTAEEIIEI